MPLVATTGTDVYYERAGHGPRLLFILGSSSTIDGSRLLLDQFVPRFDLVVHDHRGMGRSGPASGSYGMAECAADALSVMDDVGWGAARVVGLSFGGMVAQELAVTEPSRVDVLALLCTSAGGAGGSSYPLHELEALPTEDRNVALRQLMDTRFDDEWLASHPGDRRLLQLLAGGDDGLAGPGGQGARGVTEQLRARSQHDVWDRLGAITCPTLVACGRYDGIAPPGNSRAIASRVEHAELRIYDGGHPFIAQDPRSIPEIIGFLSGSTPLTPAPEPGPEPTGR